MAKGEVLIYSFLFLKKKRCERKKTCEDFWSRGEQVLLLRLGGL